MKTTVAVLFGGRSPEHDVSVISATQAMQALDSSKYDIVPVYITTTGEWLTGEVLRDAANYMVTPETVGVEKVTLVTTTPALRPRLKAWKKTAFGMKDRFIEFDAALLVFHGLVGEDGGIQGLMETAGVPYTGMRQLACTVLMDKVATKHMLASTGIPLLPFAEIRRPEKGTYVPVEEIEATLKGMKGPWIVKPSHLGSSIGVGKANNLEEVQALLPGVFGYDNAAIIEPFVENMVEYNVSVARMGGEVVTSAIEQPKTVGELLDFKEKYQSGGKSGKLVGTKAPSSPISAGMLSLTRILNPELSAEDEKNIRMWAKTCYERVFGSGGPRIDFISNSKTGEIWLNEVNPCPGSLSYFLWEASKDNHVLFADLLEHYLEEAVALNRAGRLPADPVPVAARLLKRVA